MPGREHQTVVEQIPAYALGALDADEETQVIRHLAACEICQAELAAYEDVVDKLALAAVEVEPSTSVKDRLLEQIQAAPPSDRTAVSTPTPAPTPPLGMKIRALFAGSRWQPAGALVLFILLIGSYVLWQQTRSQTPEQIVLTATESAPDARGVIEVARNGRNGTLIVEGLPRLDPDQQYQLWLIEDGQRTSGGVFSVDENGRQRLEIKAPHSLQAYGAFGITIEPAGGSPGPTGQRVLGHNL